MAGKISNTKAPEQTFEEVNYLKRLIDDRVTVRVRLSDNQEVEGDHRVLRRQLHPPDARGRTEPVPVQTRHQISLRALTLASYLETAADIAREAGR